VPVEHLGPARLGADREGLVDRGLEGEFLEMTSLSTSRVGRWSGAGRRGVRLWLALVGLLALVGGAPRAFAGSEKLRLERVDFSKSPFQRQFLSYMDVDGRVVGGLQKEELKLMLDGAEQGAAKELTSFDLTGEPVYVVAVVQASSAMQEVLEQMKSGVRALSDGIDVKSKSKIGLVAYAGDVKKLAELGNPGDVETAVGGLQLEEAVEVHLLDAVRTAIDMLNAVKVEAPAKPPEPGKAPPVEVKPRKLVVIFADGIDANMERRAFTSMAKRALDAGVVLDTIGFAPFEKQKLKNMSELAKTSNGTDRQTAGASDISQQFLNVVDEIKKQYVATFEVLLKPDKKTHTFQTVIEKGGAPQTYSNNVDMAIPAWTVAAKSSFGWLLWAGIGVGVLVVVLLVLWFVFREKEEEVEEEAPAAAPVVAAPAPAPAKNRTMALDLGSGKMPAVGWMVAMNGKHQHQTFKFKQGRATVIGTTPDCDIVIDDGFMSSRHAEVRLEGGGFRIVDLGSTNGIMVNDQRVQTHELIDGDGFRLGRTEFKFKSLT
jgi:hypothetical protein